MAEAAAVISPFDGQRVGTASLASSTDLDVAIGAARDALLDPIPQWRIAEILRSAAQSLVVDLESFARRVTSEAGKPIKQSRVEVARAAETLRLSGAEAERLAGQTVPISGSVGFEHKVAYTVRVPLGVVAAITPFNFPLNLVAHKIGPALAAGNSVVLKPALKTPLSAVALAEVLWSSGLPEERLAVVIGSGSAIGDQIVGDNRVDAISFTGSRAVGHQIARAAANKHVSLELGSTSPLLVCANSNWKRAAHLAGQHGFSFAGQSCISVQRVLVAEEVAPDFARELVAAVHGLKVGDPANEATDVGPLIDDAAASRVVEWIGEAAEDGAELLAGGGANGRMVEPTVLSNVSTAARVWCEEVFGPVVGVRAFGTFDEAIELANDSDYGLQAGVFTDDVSQALRACRELDFGGVLINDVPTVRADLQPYGGFKDSGRGREGPAWAVRELSQEKFISWQGR